MITIYLDTSVYNRPFDDQTQPRICLETLAFATILQLVEIGEITLVTSSVLAFENHKNPFHSRQQWVNYCLNYAKRHQTVNEDIQNRANQLENEGIKSMDALHVACAEFMGCDYFLTVDDRLLKRYKSNMLQMKNPVEFIFLVTEKKP